MGRPWWVSRQLVSLPLESSLVPALGLPLYSALESPLLESLLELPRVSASELLPVPAPAPPLESLLELPRVSASELPVPALASPLGSLLEPPRVSASGLLLVSALPSLLLVSAL